MFKKYCLFCIPNLSRALRISIESTSAPNLARKKERADRATTSRTCVNITTRIIKEAYDNGALQYRVTIDVSGAVARVSIDFHEIPSRGGYFRAKMRGKNPDAGGEFTS